MADDHSPPEIRLKRTGGAGPNTQWQWQLVAAGRVLKQGTALGDEAKAYATARKAGDKLRG